VDVGVTASQSVTATDIGRVTLTVQPVQVKAPFGAVMTAPAEIAWQADGVLGFTFAPVEPGAFSQTAVLASDGGNVTLLLQGTGVPAPPCSFTVAPLELDFGTVAPGQSADADFVVTNTGSAPCSVSDVQLGAGSASAFSLKAGQAPSATIGAEADPFKVTVTFGPTEAPQTFAGTVTLQVGPPGSTSTVQLTGSSGACHVKPTPAEIDFGNVVVGHSLTSGVQISNTGSAPCVLSDIAVESGSNAAFTLAHGQATSATIEVGGTPFSLKATFAPASPANACDGKISFKVLGDSTVQEVPLLGSSTACVDPNPDGSCPVATAPIYLNDAAALYSFNTTTHRATTIGIFAEAGMSFEMYDIAIDSSGDLIGVSDGSLYAINPTTAACTYLAHVSNSSPNGLTFLPDGRLVLAGEDVQILNPQTFALEQELVPPGRYSTSGDIVALPDGMLYWAVLASGNDELIRIDPSNGGLTDLGQLGASGVYGLAWADNVLYGFTAGGQYLAINPTSAASVIGSTPGSWYGATTNPATWPSSQ
jgi:hypothetical protein